MPSAPTPSTSSLPPGEPRALPHGPWERGDPGFEPSPGAGGSVLGERGAGRESQLCSPSTPSSPFAHCSLPMAGPAHCSATGCPWPSLGYSPRRDPSPSGLGIVCCSRGALRQQDSDILFSTLSLFSLPFSLSLSVSPSPHLPSVPQRLPGKVMELRAWAHPLPSTTRPCHKGPCY